MTETQISPFPKYLVCVNSDTSGVSISFTYRTLIVKVGRNEVRQKFSMNIRSPFHTSESS